MRIARWFFGGWVSRIYLALVGLVTSFVVISESMRMADPAGPTYGMPEIVLLPLALPGVLLTLPAVNTLQDPWWLSLVLCVAAGALINVAAVKGMAAMVRRARARRDRARTSAAETIE